MNETVTTTIEAEHVMACQYTHAHGDGVRSEALDVAVSVTVGATVGEDTPGEVHGLLVGALGSYGTLSRGVRDLGATDGLSLGARLCDDLLNLGLDVRQVRWADGPAVAIIDRGQSAAPTVQLIGRNVAATMRRDGSR